MRCVCGVCVCMLHCVPVGICECAHKCASVMCGGQRITSGVTPSLPSCLRQALLLLFANIYSRLAGCELPGIALPLPSFSAWEHSGFDCMLPYPALERFWGSGHRSSNSLSNHCTP